MRHRVVWAWAPLALAASLTACTPQQIGGFLLNSAASSLGLPTLGDLPSPGASAAPAWGANSVDPPPSAGPAATLLARVNELRRRAGLAGVGWSQSLADGCQKHAAYMLINLAQPGLKPREEDPSLPGHSAEGAAVAATAELAYLAPEEALSSWVGSFYHRLPLFDPKLRALGLGSMNQGQQHVTVVAFDRQDSHPGGPYPVAYPAAQEREVPTTLPSEESPNPLPEDASRPVGYPITLSFPPQEDWRLDEASLKDAKGQVVACHLSHPGAPATDFPQQNTVCLIPKAPLQSGSSYEVSVYATGPEGLMKPYRWRFHTAAAQP